MKISSDEIMTIIPYHEKIYAEHWLGKLLSRKQEETEVNESMTREHKININRAGIQKLFKDKKEVAKHVLLLDSDVLASEKNLNQLLEEYDGITPLCIDTKNKISDLKDFDETLSDEEILNMISGHVVCACCLMPAEDWQKINYLDNPDICQCKKIKNAKYAMISCEEFKDDKTENFNIVLNDGYPSGITVFKTQEDGTIKSFSY